MPVACPRMPLTSTLSLIHSVRRVASLVPLNALAMAVGSHGCCAHVTSHVMGSWPKEYHLVKEYHLAKEYHLDCHCVAMDADHDSWDCGACAKSEQCACDSACRPSPQTLVLNHSSRPLPQARVDEAGVGICPAGEVTFMDTTRKHTLHGLIIMLLMHCCCDSCKACHVSLPSGRRSF